MKYKQYTIISRMESRDFHVNVYDPSNNLIGSVGRVGDAIDLIDELCKQASFILEG